MNCPVCETKLRVTHTVQVEGERAETRNHRCPKCGFRATSVTVLMPPRKQKKSQGAAAWAVAQKLTEGELAVRVEKRSG